VLIAGIGSIVCPAIQSGQIGLFFPIGYITDVAPYFQIWLPFQSECPNHWSLSWLLVFGSGWWEMEVVEVVDFDCGISAIDLVLLYIKNSIEHELV